MNKQEFLNQNKIHSKIELKDGRTIYTTENGFSYYVCSKNDKVDKIDEKLYKLALKHRKTKRNSKVV